MNVNQEIGLKGFPKLGIVPESTSHELRKVFKSLIEPIGHGRLLLGLTISIRSSKVFTKHLWKLRRMEDFHFRIDFFYVLFLASVLTYALLWYCRERRAAQR